VKFESAFNVHATNATYPVDSDHLLHCCYCIVRRPPLKDAVQLEEEALARVKEAVAAKFNEAIASAEVQARIAARLKDERGRLEARVATQLEEERQALLEKKRRAREEARKGQVSYMCRILRLQDGPPHVGVVSCFRCRQCLAAAGLPILRTSAVVCVYQDRPRHM
jgi:hypothetical protein